MKISELKQMYSTQMSTLWTRKQELAKLLREPSASGPNRDRDELSHELSQVSEDYERLKDGMEQLQQKEMLMRSADASRQETEATAKAIQEMLKCLEIARRIANGDRVPPSDEKKLLEYDFKLYMAAKNLAVANQKSSPKEYDSLWKDEKKEVLPQGENNYVGAANDIFGSDSPT